MKLEISKYSAYLYLAEAKIPVHHTIQVTQTTLVDVDKEGNPIGVQFLNSRIIEALGAEGDSTEVPRDSAPDKGGPSAPAANSDPNHRKKGGE